MRIKRAVVQTAKGVGAVAGLGIAFGIYTYKLSDNPISIEPIDYAGRVIFVLLIIGVIGFISEALMRSK